MNFPAFQNTYNRPGIELLPHRAPFLFLDRLLSADETGSLGEYTFTAEKNDFFRGHFPGHPIVPGVVLIEAMCQSAGAGIVALDILGGEDRSSRPFFLAAIANARFRRPVVPDDRLVTVARVTRRRAGLCVFALQGYVGETLAVECEAKCMLGK